MKVFLFPLILCSAALIASAENSGPANPVRGCEPGRLKALDFWLGSWDVSSDGKLAGHSTVARTANNCVVVERWFGTDGDSGVSFNFLDTAGNLRQVYVGEGWSIDYRGTPRPTAVEFNTVRTVADGSTRNVRMSLEARDDGSVRQHKERSRGGSEWNKVYDFLYQRAKSPWAGQEKAAPECNATPYRSFDFWHGEWTVYIGTKVVGGNRIESAAGGCALIENWHGAGGEEGNSLNFYDAGGKTWRQVWVGTQEVLELSGQLRDGVMELSGVTRRQDNSNIDEITFTPAADGSVRQLWRASKDSGKTWTVLFDGKYVRRL